jgi:fructuronate reductase
MIDTLNRTPLRRETTGLATRRDPRIVHIGLGAFHRAHQAWYTQHADDDWGIVAFTGRSPRAAQQLAHQDGIYTLVTRSARGDTHEIIDSIVEVHDGTDLAALTTHIAATTAIITLTITEAGYHCIVGANPPDLDVDDPAVRHDITALRAIIGDGRTAITHQDWRTLELTTVPARIVLGLAARRDADAWPLAIMSCDNLPHNGAVARAAITTIAEHVDPQLAEWIREHVSFVDSSIDRITPRTTDTDKCLVAHETGYSDISPVVTEPFSSWVICGEFPAGRPAWENAGAEFVTDVRPYERRKLWLLNGAHSLMAYAGQLRGHAAVSDAMLDPEVTTWIAEFWDEASQHLTASELDVATYRLALTQRFANPRIEHRLAQVADDGSLKLAARAIPVYQAEREAGRPGTAALRLLAAWCDYLVVQHRNAVPIHDPHADTLTEILTRHAKTPRDLATTRELVTIIDPALAQSTALESIHNMRGSF